MKNSFFADPEGTDEEILKATYTALQKHGYADLTINKIGQEFNKSTSLIYHHYQSKDELILDCLSDMLEQFVTQQSNTDSTDAKQRLETLLYRAISDTTPEETSFLNTLIELQSRAIHDDAYRQHFSHTDEVYKKQISSIIRTGIKQNTFRDCDPEKVGEFLTTIVSGFMLRQATTSNVDRSAVRSEITAYLNSQVYLDTD